jgi:AcrR family transcriptional regulator
VNQGSGTLSRRERVRAATEAEILTTARGLLVEGGFAAITLREVARRMGMTSPALYRYVDSHEDLLDRLAAVLLAELTATVEGSLAFAPPGADALDALCRVGRAFRSWSVSNPAEFGLLFGPRPPGSASSPGHLDGGERLRISAVFGDRLLESVCTAATLDPHEAPDGTLARMPADLANVYIGGWVRLVGTVAMEVFGHLTWTDRPREEIFEVELADIADRLMATVSLTPNQRRQGAQGLVRKSAP